MPKYVGSRGSISARLFILAEAPGQYEEEAGLPLVGPTGKLTEKFAHEAGFALAEAFIVNVVRERPQTYYLNGKAVNNDINQFITDKKKQALAQGFIQHNGLWVKPVVLEWLEQLEREITLINPRLILGLGRIALWALLGRPAKISEWRGTFFEKALPVADTNIGKKTCSVLATFHPASVFRNPNAAAFIARDFGRVVGVLAEKDSGGQSREGLLESGERQVVAQGFHFTIRPTLEVAHNFLSGFLARLDSAGSHLAPVKVAVDIETKSKQIDCIGFGLSSTEAFCIPIMCRAGSYWSEEEEVEIVNSLREVLGHPNLQVLGQNFSYDAQYLARQWGIPIPCRLYDTMVSWHVLFPGLEKGLDVLNSLFASHPEQWKPENKEVSRRWTDEENWTYNCKDCCATFIVAEQLPALIAKEGLQAPWAFQHRQLPAVQRMMLRGVKWNSALAAELDADLSARIERVQENIDFIAGHPLNVGSNGATGQMQRFFYGDLQIPPVFKRLTKQVSTGKEALPVIAKREPLLRPLTQLIEHRRRMATYRSTFIRARTDWDGRMRSSFNVAGTETFRYASRGDAFWLGCLPKEAEVLTPRGWQTLERTKSGERVLQWEPTTKELTFAPCQKHIECAPPYMLRFKSEQGELLVTPDHRVGSWSLSHRIWQVWPAKEVAKAGTRKLPVSGWYRGGELEVSAPRLLTAIWADGSKEGRRARIAVKKTRKKERLLHLLDLYDIKFTLHKGQEGYLRLAFNWPYDWPEQKGWGLWAMSLRPEILDEVLDEAQYWDATARGESYIFYTADEAQADWFLTLAHLAGRSGTKRRVEQNEGSYSDTVMWWVNVKPRTEIVSERKHWTQEEAQDPLVHCVSVPTKFFLVRYRGKISITGNTNLQNFPKGKDTALLELLEREGSQPLERLSDQQREAVTEAVEVGFVSVKDGLVEANPNFRLPNVRKLICPDPGMILASCDLSGADFQLVVWEAGDEALKQQLRAGLRIHAENAKVLGWNPNDSQDYDMAKRFVHLTNYGGKERTCAISLSSMSGRHVTIEEMKAAQARWFHEHPSIRQWHERVQQELRDKHEIRNRFGFRRYYFDPPDSILPEALAWVPQSTVALVTDHGICNLDEQFSKEGLEVLLQVHDESVFQFPIANLPRLPAYLEALKIPIPYDDPLTIPIQCKLSTKSWGELVPMEKFNPEIH